MIWMTEEMVLKTHKIELLPRSDSDHNPMIWKSIEKDKQFLWRINEDLLDKKETLDLLRKETQLFFQQNLDQGTSIQVVWDAYKALMRGILISQNVKLKKENFKKQAEVLEKISQKENEIKKKPGKKKIIRELQLLREQLNVSLNQEMYWNLKKLQQKSFEEANKPGKFLAWQLKSRREEND